MHNFVPLQYSLGLACDFLQLINKNVIDAS